MNTYSLATNIERLEASATEELENTVKNMQQAGIDDIISLGVGEPCYETPGFIVQAAQRALENGMTKYQPTGGSYELREAIAAKLSTENNIAVSPTEILVTPGAKFAIYLALQAILEPEDAVMILDPSWVSHPSIPAIMGSKVIRIQTSATEDYQPDIRRIADAIDTSCKVIILNSPNNPTGAAYEPDLIRQIVELALRSNIIVLSDEVYEYLLYDGAHFSPGSEYGNVITVNGFSKSYAMTGWRLGYVTAPSKILEGMIKIYQHSASCVTAFAQAGAIAALKDPKGRIAVGEMVDGYRRRRGLMLNLINESEFLACETAQGAFYCFASYDSDLPSVEFAHRLLKTAHVATVPGAAFGACGESHLRLSYSAAEEDMIQAFERMEDYAKTQVKHG